MLPSVLDIQRPLSARGIARDALERVLGQSAYVAEMDGALVVRVKNRVVQPADVQKLLASFGDLMTFVVVGSGSVTEMGQVGVQVFVGSYTCS